MGEKCNKDKNTKNITEDNSSGIGVYVCYGLIVLVSINLMISVLFKSFEIKALSNVDKKYESKIKEQKNKQKDIVNQTTSEQLTQKAIMEKLKVIEEELK